MQQSKKSGKKNVQSREFRSVAGKQKLYRDEQKRILKKLRQDGLSGQVVSIDRSDTQETLDVMEYFEKRNILESKKLLEQKTAKQSLEVLNSKEASLQKKKEAILCLGAKGNKASLALLKKYETKSEGILNTWSCLARDEILVKLGERAGEPRLVLTKVQSKGTGLDDFNDRLIKFAPYYFCDNFCFLCCQKSGCSFWLDFSFGKNKSKGVSFLAWPDKKMFFDLVFPQESSRLKNLELFDFYEASQETTGALATFFSSLLFSSRKFFWLEAAFRQEIKELALAQNLFWEKSILAGLVFESRNYSQKNVDSAYRLAALSLFALGLAEKKTAQIASQAPQLFFAQYLQTKESLEKTKRFLKERFPLVEKYREKVIINHKD